LDIIESNMLIFKFFMCSHGSWNVCFINIYCCFYIYIFIFYLFLYVTNYEILHLII
jgi:hypothetical protein